MAKKRSIFDRYTVNEKYIITRGKALTFPAMQFNVPLKEDDVYGVVVDMPMTPTVLVTLVCYINGAANLYFNLGGDYSGSASRYRAVAQAAHNFVKGCTGFVKECEKTTKYDLPIGGTHYVYMLTKNGTYKISIAPTAIPAEDKTRRIIFNMYNSVMNELRTAQLKDQAAGIETGIN